MTVPSTCSYLEPNQSSLCHAILSLEDYDLRTCVLFFLVVSLLLAFSPISHRRSSVTTFVLYDIPISFSFIWLFKLYLAKSATYEHLLNVFIQIANTNLIKKGIWWIISVWVSWFIHTLLVLLVWQILCVNKYLWVFLLMRSTFGILIAITINYELRRNYLGVKISILRHQFLFLPVGLGRSVVEENLSAPYFPFFHSEGPSFSSSPEGSQTAPRSRSICCLQWFGEERLGEGKEASCQFVKISGVKELPHASEELRQ
jgi:hypothetical protein